MPENRRPQRPTGKKTTAGRGGGAPTGRGAGQGRGQGGGQGSSQGGGRGSGQAKGGGRSGGQGGAGRSAPTSGAQGRGGRSPARPPRDDRPPRTKDQAEYDGPDLPESVTGKELDRSVTAQLKGLPEKLAARVARHLAAAGLYIDQDPELAYRHALAARSRAPRLAVVREAAGEAAYASGHYAEALADLRAAKRMNGATAYLPIMADCHRALGQPDQAVKLAKSPSVEGFAPPAKAEMTIVEAGARRDMGQVDAALRILEQAPLMSKSREPWVVRLRYAYADALAEAGRTEEALAWFHRTQAIDSEELTDAAQRAADLEKQAQS
ncbi:tetratricopeptide repeat protein [Nocardioides anomalus]|uniref:tetratricopeptide repeat protein n=1 Tax=Nocardioides anomalus TaxID=2712223 RepID=UPI0018AD3510|nr:tetratricopeptide repeat protein [Nocardioides anomalus]